MPWTKRILFGHMVSNKRNKWIYTSGGTEFMFLESFTKHPSRSTADHFSSPFCVAGVGRSIITLFWIYMNSKLLEGGDATGVRQSSMLGFYGKRVCRRRNQTCSLWGWPFYGKLSKRNFCPTSVCIYNYVYSIIYVNWNVMYVCLYVCMSVCLSVCLSVCMYVCMSVCLSVYLSVCMSVCMSVCIYVCMSV